MNTPDDTSSSDGAKKDVADSVKFLGSALCKPVTVRLTRLTMKEINQHRTKVKQKKRRHNLWRFGTLNSWKSRNKKAKLRKIRKEQEEKKKSMLRVDEPETCPDKTETNKEKTSTDQLKTDDPIEKGSGKRLGRKRKCTDELDIKQNILPPKRQKLITSYATVGWKRVLKNTGLSTDLDSSTKYTKDDSVNTKQLYVPLTKLEDIKDDVYVNIWKSKSIEMKDKESDVTFKTENDKQLAEALGSVALQLNTIYPAKTNKKRGQTDSHDSPLEKDNTNSDLPTNLSAVHKKSVKLQRKKRKSVKKHKLLKHPKIVLTKLGNEEAPTSSLDMDETLKIFGNNDDDDEDLINEITLLTNDTQCTNESSSLLDKTLSMSSLESSPRPSPILGRSAVKHQTMSKLRWNLQNTYNTVNETSNEKSDSDINCEIDKSESKEDETGVRSLRRTAARSQWRLAQRSQSRAGFPSKRVLTRAQKKHLTRSLSRMEFHSPSRSLSRSVSPDVTTDSSKTIVHDQKKSTTRDLNRTLKHIRDSAETDACSITATRRSHKNSSPPPSSVTSIDNDNTVITKSSSSAYSTKNNLVTSSVEETSVSPNKSPAKSPVRPSIHSPSRARSTLTFMSPQKTAKSSVTELQAPSSDGLKESEIPSATDTSERENTPASVECRREPERVSSEDEDSIELIIDDESTKETTETTLSALPLRNSANEFSTDQDQVVPMQESAVEFSGSSTETEIHKIDKRYVDNITVDTKRSKSVITTQRNPVSDVLDNNSATTKLLPTRRIKALGRVSLGRTKPEKLKSGSKSKNSATSLKCIVCDSEYKTYKELQEHLKNHSGRQTTSTSGILATDPCSDSMLDANAREQTFQDIGAPPSMCSKTACSVDSSSTSNEESRSLSAQVTECSSETSDVPSTTPTKSETPQKKSKITPSPKALKSKERKMKYCNSSNSCGVCFQKFESKVKLAEHIYVHTEKELQIAYESARASESSNHQVESVRITMEASKLDDKVENNTVPMTVEDSNVEAQDLTMDNAASTTSLENRECEQETDRMTGSGLVDKGGKPKETKSNSEKTKKSPQKKKTSSTPTRKEVSTPKSKNPPTGKEAEGTVNHIEIITLDEPECETDTTDNNQSLGRSSDANTERDTIVGTTKPITVCECHRNDVTYGNYLRIEVSLLCHSCRTVYRSMECFEVHYRLPQHAECSKNRLHGRSPKLFCTNCGMIFSSIQDVRQHLELHARYNTNVSTDFRCNLCKVIFIGIGSLFYIHWSNHLKNPLYIASKLSFPKNSVLTAKNKQNVKASTTDEYLYVAEHVCDGCKEPFSTGNDLEKHYQSCKQITKKITPNKIASPNNDVRIQPKIRLVCGICEQIFLDKFLFEKHAELKHKQHTEPQYICVSLATMNTMFSCSACTKMYGKLQDLENHWKTHDTERERYMCKNCDKLHDSLESFVEHAKQHVSDLSNVEVSCKVIYQESEFICKACKFGFDSKVSMNKHFEIHGVNLPWQGAEKTFQQQPTDLCMAKSIPVDPLEKPQNKTGKTKENAVTGEQQREEEKGASGTANDKNEVNASCGQEEAEASEGELVIDYREMAEDERLQKTREKVTPSSTPVEVTPEIKDRTSTAPIEQSSVPTDCTEKSTSHNPEPPRKGFLRVKTLAELTDDNVARANQCFTCKAILNTADELTNHVLTAHSNVSAEQVALHQSKRQGPSNVMFQRPESRNNISNNTTLHPLPSKSSNAPNYQPMLKIHGRLHKCGIRGKTNDIPQQQKPTWHTSEDRPPIINHTPKPVSGYHKNLPACPSTRPLSTATQRLPVRSTIPARPKESTSTSAILKIPQPTAAGQPQVEQTSRTTIYLQSLQRPVQNSSMPSANNTELNSNPPVSTTTTQAADDYNCRICPQFKGTSVADYILHEISAEHEARKKTLTAQSSTTKNPTYRTYEELVAETTANERTTTIHSGNVVQNQQQQPRLQEVYAAEVYSEPMQIYTPVETNQIINYTVPRNLFVNTSNITQNVTPLNTPTLITVSNTGNVYQPVVFNNPTGIAVINSYSCFFCSRTFVNNNSLNLHINMNHPYACILCREEFSGLQELETHKIKHGLVWN